MINTDSSLKISRIEGIASSFPVKQGVTLGIGRAVKRDAIIVKVTTESGLVGWGESHHGRFRVSSGCNSDVRNTRAVASPMIN